MQEVCLKYFLKYCYSIHLIYFLQTMVSVLLVQYNDIFFLIEVVGFANSCILATTYASMLYLRYKHPEIPRPIKVNAIAL